MKYLTLVGAGGHGRIAADLAAVLGYGPIEFLDKNWPDMQKNEIWPVIGKPDEAALAKIAQSAADVFVSVGDNRARQQISQILTGAGKPCLIHPSANISPNAKIGDGTIVVAGVAVNCFATIGDGVILNTACTVDHDCRIDDFVHISPGVNLAGNVSVGARSWVGIGAIVKEGIVIGRDVMIGAGAVVVNDVADGSKVVGVPARAM